MNNYIKEDVLSYKAFTVRIKNEMDKVLGDDYMVVINNITKNNGQEMDGLIIHSKYNNVSPIIYLEGLYNEYLGGMNINDVISRIIMILDNSSGKEYEDLFISEDYSEVKGSIIFKVVNYEKNENMLQNLPHIKFVDLAVVFMYLVNTDSRGIASVKIHIDHMNMWNVDEEQLFRDALVNTERIFPCTIRTMNEVIREIVNTNPGMLLGEDIDWMSEDESEYRLSCDEESKDNKIIDQMLDKLLEGNQCDMYILSNNNGINGAAVILYKGLLSKISARLDSDFMILPSSVHEVILVPVNNINVDDMEIKKIVEEINITQVPKEEVLSDNVYYYLRGDNVLRIA